ncbi:cytochrome b/b6 domain-containing protein [Altererythrobacter sp. KTW20L]|uniref:cytochrome b/b6 domain-containing protein n=1 Tax=Altererythrobacter sp. KTW20L TaxID=2942210 RepID=UPI0020C03BEB|nr:cytochrome b/b6 domain-containing protein [Altererythrobacter sp. KTW20L]MCL6249470.1 cytochrome b/b6 domain-containing protein [Altererythrobacter sp. KTW20L]
MIGQAAERYSRGAILLHWIIAAALALVLAIGFGMPRDASGFALFQFHKSLGITILVFTLVRIGWRLTHRPPPPVERGFNGFLAGAVHFGLYAFMILAPLTGWALVSTSPIQVPTVLFGLVPLPHLPLDPALAENFENAHWLMAWIGLALFALHVAGAMKHHLLMRDGVLARMSPGGSAKAGMVLFGVVLLVGAVTFAILPGHEEGSEPVEQDIAAVAPDSASTDEAAAVEEPEATEEVVEETEEAAEPDEPAGPPPSWSIQPGGSLRFVADNAGTAMRGSFRRWDGSITMDPENPAGADIRIEIELGSATLGDATQDTMLAGGDFFGISANPTATFRSTNVTRTGANSYRANGTLSLKGASRSQAITFTLSGSGATRAVSGSATVDRTGFGVGTGENAAGLAPSVRVEFAFDATRD